MMRVPASRYVLFLLLAVLGLAIDLSSKNAVFQALGTNGASDWTERWFDGWMTFSFRTTFNRGALWGLGQGLTWLFASLSIVAIAGVVYWLFIRGAARSWWLTIALALIMAGTLGNLYDRLGWHNHREFDGNEVRPIYAVRDFLLFTFGDFHWPVFNFADVFLVTGAIMLILQSFKAEEPAVAAIEPAPADRVASGS